MEVEFERCEEAVQEVSWMVLAVWLLRNPLRSRCGTTIVISRQQAEGGWPRKRLSKHGRQQRELRQAELSRSS